MYAHWPNYKMPAKCWALGERNHNGSWRLPAGRIDDGVGVLGAVDGAPQIFESVLSAMKRPLATRSAVGGELVEGLMASPGWGLRFRR